MVLPRFRPRPHSLLLALFMALATAPPSAAVPVNLFFEGRPNQVAQPWAVTYSWGRPTKGVWPVNLVYTATDGGTAVYTAQVTRESRVIAGRLEGVLTVQRRAPEDSGGDGYTLVAKPPIVELWQAAGPLGAVQKSASAPCKFDGGAATARLEQPGLTARCTYSFPPPFNFDPEQRAELRVGSIAFDQFGPPNGFSGFAPYPIDPYGPQPSPGRCAEVTDTMFFSNAGGRATPYNLNNVQIVPLDGSPQKAPAAPGMGQQVCGTTVFRYSARFPPVTCGPVAFPA
ncbi:hypothetical protein MNEG_14763 [Monoraphidium neglectum]|uniref:Uncharacterized protein n=1 Tax=Monoraphidium neglectum TaxID=145388 RepID=A0A0D2LUA6_9CHLO|nr:hypothetical protein MNEG_14763 [Monoraphidium neglectum]KIY93201.1 hypothetical protein MNEG_14763 [Monoraphidium neglectum]|eukprot:XP_013892221.1 hypothetical protein MNEG_14763 [Monoraphidium neglectum]